MLCVHIRVACVHVFTIFSLQEHLLATVGLKRHIHSQWAQDTMAHCSQASGPYSNISNTIECTGKTKWKKEQVSCWEWNLWDSVSDSCRHKKYSTPGVLSFFCRTTLFCFLLQQIFVCSRKKWKPFQSLPSKIFLLCLELIACGVAVHGKLLQRMLTSSHIVMCWSIAAVS